MEGRPCSTGSRSRSRPGNGWAWWAATGPGRPPCSGSSSGRRRPTPGRSAYLPGTASGTSRSNSGSTTPRCWRRRPPRSLRGWRGALLLITHDRDFMDGVTTHTMAIHRGRVRKMSGGTEKLYAQILQEEEIHEQTRMNDEKKRKDAEIFIARFRAQATKARAVQSRIKALARHERLEKLSEIRDLDFRFAEAPFTGKWMMEVRDLSFGYDAGPPLIEGLSFPVAKGDRIAVVGPNGRGKTTLLRLLAGELPPSAGAVKPTDGGSSP